MKAEKKLNAIRSGIVVIGALALVSSPFSLKPNNTKSNNSSLSTVKKPHSTTNNNNNNNPRWREKKIGKTVMKRTGGMLGVEGEEWLWLKLFAM
ncbi:hypothetical protein NC653_021979 [Populus alba x Populus x berolinensis]|uniref:Uncharacterized protein n=1 Tax=Populus alba x Populus x berolinensis TaxID=444605 RepID=A0AAD6QF70_9ROSI|nr:hypothetical protein NC653_021979 [Populus alba x Populus x berolinensis]